MSLWRWFSKLKGIVKMKRKVAKRKSVEARGGDGVRENGGAFFVEGE